MNTIDLLAAQEGLSRGDLIRRALGRLEKRTFEAVRSRNEVHQLRIALDDDMLARLNDLAGGPKGYGAALEAAIEAYQAQALNKADSSASQEAQASLAVDVAIPDHDYFTPEQLAILRGKIVALRKQAIEVLRSDKKSVFYEGTRGDEADVASTVQQRDQAEAELARARQLFVETERALAKLRNGSYGYCEATDEPIEWERLLANPLARYSLEEQERLERQSRLMAA